MIDDYQAEVSTGTSSSGGSVTFEVLNLTEDRVEDNNSTFTWASSDPVNGMTRAGSSDSARGVVFDWTIGSIHYNENEVIPTPRDSSDDDYLSFHTCQGIRRRLPSWMTYPSNGISNGLRVPLEKGRRWEPDASSMDGRASLHSH